jgi:SNF2 family DNA or RNA helicase
LSLVFRQRKIFTKSLVSPGANLVICDEGHKIRNPKSKISIILKEVASQRRIVLTGNSSLLLP